MGKVGSRRGRELRIINFSKTAFCSMLVHISPHRGNHVFQTLRVYPPLHRRTCVCADRISSAAAERVFSQSVQLRQISSDYAEIWYMHTSCIGFKSLNFPFSRMNFTDFMPLLEKNGQKRSYAPISLHIFRALNYALSVSCMKSCEKRLHALVMLCIMVGK